MHACRVACAQRRLEGRKGRKEEKEGRPTLGRLSSSFYISLRVLYEGKRGLLGTREW